jgi:CDP-diacylglycerol--glycerol-3-phosphate 3-phosphatidyltransferase
MERLDAWVAILIISREFAVTGLRMIAVAEGKVIAASNWGKLKTWIQIITIAVLILNNFPFSTFSFPLDVIMIWATVFITLFSGIDYFIKNKDVINIE